MYKTFVKFVMAAAGLFCLSACNLDMYGTYSFQHGGRYHVLEGNTETTGKAIQEYFESIIDFDNNETFTGTSYEATQYGSDLFDKTLETGYAHYWSRSRQKLWKKGEESGHLQKVIGVYLDCDSDCVLLKVQQKGAACHTGNYTCFFTPVRECGVGAEMLGQLQRIVEDRKENPEEGSYTNYLFDKGVSRWNWSSPPKTGTKRRSWASAPTSSIIPSFCWQMRA